MRTLYVRERSLYSIHRRNFQPVERFMSGVFSLLRNYWLLFNFDILYFSSDGCTNKCLLTYLHIVVGRAGFTSRWRRLVCSCLTTPWWWQHELTATCRLKAVSSTSTHLTHVPFCHDFASKTLQTPNVGDLLHILLHCHTGWSRKLNLFELSSIMMMESTWNSKLLAKVVHGLIFWATLCIN